MIELIYHYTRSTQAYHRRKQLLKYPPTPWEAFSPKNLGYYLGYYLTKDNFFQILELFS